MAPKKKVTSSGDRSKRSTNKPVTQGQNPQRANRQSVSRAQVSSSANRDPYRVRAGLNQRSNVPGNPGRVTGTMGRRKPATSANVTRSKPIGTGGGGISKPSGLVNAEKPTMRQIRAKAQTLRQRTQNPTPRGQGAATRLPNSARQGVNLPRTGARVLRQQAAGTTSPASQARAQAQGQAARKAAETRRAARAVSQRMVKKLAQAGATRALGTVARRAPLAAVAAAGIQSYNSGNGTLSAAMKRGDYKPKQGPAAPKTTQASFNKKTFDQAFKAARTSGAKEFTWRGKRYNTKMKGE